MKLCFYIYSLKPTTQRRGNAAASAPEAKALHKKPKEQVKAFLV